MKVNKILWVFSIVLIVSGCSGTGSDSSSDDQLDETKESPISVKVRGILGEDFVSEEESSTDDNDFVSSAAIVKLADGTYRKYYSETDAIYTAISSDGNTWYDSEISLSVPMARSLDVTEMDDGGYLIMYGKHGSDKLFQAMSRDGVTFKTARNGVACSLSEMERTYPQFSVFAFIILFLLSILFFRVFRT